MIHVNRKESTYEPILKVITRELKPEQINSAKAEASFIYKSKSSASTVRDVSLFTARSLSCSKLRQLFESTA